MAARAGSARRKGAAAAALRAGTRAGRATQVGGEGRAERRKVHTLARRPTCGAVSESQRGGARGTRAGRARARGRGRRAGSRSGPAGRSERRGARRWERFASGGAARLPPAAPDAAPSSAEPHPGAPAPPRRLGVGRARGRIRSAPRSPAGPGLPGGSTLRGPRGCADGPGQPLTSARRRRSPRAGWTRGCRDRRGRTDEEEAKQPGWRARAPGILRGDVAGRGPVALKSPNPSLKARGARWEPSFLALPGTS